MLTPIPIAIKKIFENLPTLSNSEEIDIEHSLGRVISDDIFSNINMPPFNKSAVDGYAVKISDTPGKLFISQVVQAGSFPDRPLKNGEAALIMTGAPIPDGTEAVVMREHTNEEKEYVEIPKKIKAGANIAFMGEDIKKGDLILKKGTRIKISTIALLATLGIRKVKVSKTPNIAIIVTGNELIEPGEKDINGGYIYNANGYSLQAACREIGIEPYYIGIVKDNLKSISSAINKAGNREIILISGGVSMGDYDYVREAIEKWGGKVIFHKVAIKPGKPFLFAKKDNQIVFGMPGNPVSVMTSFWKFIKPAIYKMQGAELVFPMRFPAKFKGEYKKKSDRPHYISTKISVSKNELFAEYIKSNGSADIPAFNMGEAMIEVPQDTTILTTGEQVEIIPLHLPLREHER